MSTTPGGSPGWDDDEGIMARFQRSQTPSGHPPRPPSRSMIPVPSVQISGASRPGSAMSHYRPDSSMSFRGSVMRSQTPDGGLVLRMAMTPRPGGVTPRLPPSSFKESGGGGGGGGSGTNTPRTPGGASSSGTGGSRPSSRAGAATPSHQYEGTPLHVYVPASMKDPLDVEVARIVNGLAHGLLIERVDPPLRREPKEGEEVRAQYVVASSLVRKVISCKLTTMNRVGGKGVTKKVMCRVGGGKGVSLSIFLEMARVY